MPIADSLLPEFDHEMANTRKTLERVPEDKLAWKPHKKSGTMGWLAHHLAQLPGWAVDNIEQDSHTIDPASRVPQPKSKKEVLETFDANVRAARAALAGANDARLAQPWSLLSQGRTIFTMPRIAVIRAMVMNHIIHHRAQLTMYLRLNNIAVPALYGPSADEGTM